MAGDQPGWVAVMTGVKWQEIEHAYGPAVDIPELIRTITSGSEADAFEACGTLSNNLNHQGSLYPATGPAVPFLIEALRSTAVGSQVRAGLLSLLAGIAAGTIEEAKYVPTSAVAGPGNVPSREVFARVWCGAEWYTRVLVSDPGADVRMEAAHLLGVLVGQGLEHVPVGVPIRFDEVVAALLGRLGMEEDGLALSSAVFALGQALAHDAGVRRALRELLGRTGGDEAVRVAAALALVEADVEQHEEAAAVEEMLIDTMSRAAETDLLFQPRIGERAEGVRYLPWVLGKLRFRVCRTLCTWIAGDEARMRQVLPALLVGVRSANEYTAASDIGPVLQWLWPGRDIGMKEGRDGKLERELPSAVTSGELTGMRRVVVEACYGNPGVWKPPIGNTDLAFMHVGLPASRAELGKLLGGT